MVVLLMPLVGSTAGIMTGQRVRVLERTIHPDDEEDPTVKEVTKLWVYQACSMLP